MLRKLNIRPTRAFEVHWKLVAVVAVALRLVGAVVRVVDELQLVVFMFLKLVFV